MAVTDEYLLNFVEKTEASLQLTLTGWICTSPKYAGGPLVGQRTARLAIQAAIRRKYYTKTQSKEAT